MVANECIVRAFYFIRRLAIAIKDNNVNSLEDFKMMDWNSVKPINNPTIARMLSVSTGVFTALDICDAFVTQKYWVWNSYFSSPAMTVLVNC